MKRGPINGAGDIRPSLAAPRAMRGLLGGEPDAEVRAPGRDLRCHCGSLVARIVDGQLGIKCRRCQRLGLVRLPEPGVESEEIVIRWREVEKER